MMSKFLDAVTIIGILVLFALASSDLLACEDHAYPYVRGGAGYTVNFFGMADAPNSGELAGTWDVGMRIPTDNPQLWLNINWNHQSWITSFADGDESRDTLSFGAEYRFIK